MGRLVRVDEEVVERLKVIAESHGLVFVSPNTVLRYILGMEPDTSAYKSPKEWPIDKTFLGDE